MTREETVRMAKEAGFETDPHDVWITDGYWANELERFAELHKQQLIRDGWRQCAEGQRTTQFCGPLEAAVLAEREACAKIADEASKRNFPWGSENSDIYHAQADWAERIAKNIRARGDK